ncbi:MAG: hypothetical protein AB199_01720 [Parcubacteria bacterium C7867-004]|nr:MAG: hypothetical protein AB199_01720 [Parcubacteria bacterium C7867-004]
MNEREFEQIAIEEWKRVPDRFKGKIQNLALLIEDEPDQEVRELEALEEGETLLGLYRGVPLTERGSEYGIGMTLPDTITLYRLPIIEEAEEMDRAFRDAVRIVVRETIWHEVGHYFGHGEESINEREDDGTNRFES